MGQNILDRKLDRRGGSFHYRVNIHRIRDKHGKLSIVDVAHQPPAMEGLGGTKENSLRLSGIQDVGDIAIEETPAQG